MDSMVWKPWKCWETDFFLFDRVKKPLRGTRFNSRKEVMEKLCIYIYRVSHLAFGISTTGILSLKGVITFMTYQKFSFLFDIYEMGHYTLEQNWEILKTYFQSGESSTQTVRNLRGKEMPSTQFVDQFVKRIRQTGSLLNKATRSRARSVRSTENIATVAQSMLE